jgi:nitroreductase
MKTFEDLIKARYSCRNFSSRPVDQKAIGQLLEMARFAPSATNAQPWEVTVITQPDNLQKVYQSYNREWIKSAPVVLLFCAVTDKAWERSDGKNHSDLDIAILVDHLTLLATEMGLGTCWVCNFDASILSELFDIPLNIEPVVLLPLGYPASDDIPVKKRKELSTFVYWK